MSAPAWMPFYVADYLADTSHLNAAESGAYLHLIMHYWQNGGLPTEDRKLARIARMTDVEWDDAKDTIAAFFDDGWKHGRIDHELRTACETMEKRSAAGKRAACARYAKRTSNGKQSNAPKGVGIGTTETLTSPKEASTREADADPPANDFEAFWSRWPNPMGYGAAEEAFEMAMEVATLDEIVAGVDRYVRGKPPDQAWVSPERWLREQRWRDGEARKPSETPSKPVTWVKEGDPRWDGLASRHERERKRKPSPVGSKHDAGLGYYFPTEWLTEAA